MRILLIRHAAAEDRSASGGDLARELTEEGRKKAAKAFKGLSRIYEGLDMILCSEAARAYQTACILADAFQCKTVLRVGDLNPGCTYATFRKAIRQHAYKAECIAVVGHEPDFSRLTAAIAGDGVLRVDVKKASCIELDVNALCKGELRAVIPPRIAAAVKRIEED